MNLPFDPNSSLSFIQQMIVHGVVLLTETPTDFIVHENWIAYPDEPGEEATRGHTEHHSAKERVAITPPLKGNWEMEFAYMEFPNVEVYKRYCQEEHEIDQGHNVFLTPIEYERYLKKEEEKKLREQRMRMEAKCQEIMKKYKIEHVDSVAFFEKVEELAEEEKGGWERKIEGFARGWFVRWIWGDSGSVV